MEVLDLLIQALPFVLIVANYCLVAVVLLVTGAAVVVAVLGVHLVLLEPSWKDLTYLEQEKT